MEARIMKVWTELVAAVFANADAKNPLVAYETAFPVDYFTANLALHYNVDPDRLGYAIQRAMDAVRASSAPYSREELFKSFLPIEYEKATPVSVSEAFSEAARSVGFEYNEIHPAEGRRRFSAFTDKGVVQFVYDPTPNGVAFHATIALGEVNFVPFDDKVYSMTRGSFICKSSRHEMHECGLIP